MAEKPAAKPAKLGFHAEFGWFIWGFVAIGALWFFGGGLQRESSHEGAYLKPPAPLDSGQIYGKYYEGSGSNGKTKLDLPEDPAIFLRNTIKGIEAFFTPAPKIDTTVNSFTSILSKKISFDGVAGAKNSDPGTEYLRIVASENNKTLLPISGLGLQGNGLDTNKTLPRAVNQLTLGVTALKDAVSLPAGGRAIISSGRSPVGTSFRVNMCTGYLGQFQIYTPALRAECPEPLAELNRAGLDNEKACASFVKKIPRCEVYRDAFPSDISTACKVFVTEKLTYNTCALDHAKDAGFYKDEWRLFLDSTSELWKNSGEIIKLVDEKEKMVDALAY